MDALAVERSPESVISDRVWGVSLGDLAKIVFGTLTDASQDATRTAVFALNRAELVEIIPDPDADKPADSFRVRLAATTKAEREALAQLDANAKAAQERARAADMMRTRQAAMLEEKGVEDTHRAELRNFLAEKGLAKPPKL
jgi:hypothetical protein